MTQTLPHLQSDTARSPLLDLRRGRLVAFLLGGAVLRGITPVALVAGTAAIVLSLRQLQR